jgi:hypothetical protein
MARAPVSKTGGWGFESLHSCQARLQCRDAGIAAHLGQQQDEHGRVIREANIQAE